MKKLSLSISTCPNDTFMFNALVAGRLEPPVPFDIELTMNDIEELNKGVLAGTPDVSKISYAVYPLIADNYVLLDAGSALGYGNGPLLVSRHKIYPDEVAHVKIAIPGEHTTARLLLKHAFGNNLDTRSYLFCHIAEAVMSGEADAGVLIHEERFTYKDKGLRLVADLGQMWEESTDLPIPLGAIAAHRRLGDEMALAVQEAVYRSVLYAMNRPADSYLFVHDNARELSDSVCEQHIAMFVNKFSLSLAEEGRRAVEKLLAAGGMTDNDDIWLKKR
ncbi:MAG: 1,4-dihydroxy-6-naphthoate synthase [Rikenellaceae bacterium]|nr:1,4-dihydroxy-6-naphthoate synthase [Rikenellaceae bacterium]